MDNLDFGRSSQGYLGHYPAGNRASLDLLLLGNTGTDFLTCTNNRCAEIDERMWHSRLRNVLLLLQEFWQVHAQPLNSAASVPVGVLSFPFSFLSLQLVDDVGLFCGEIIWNRCIGTRGDFWFPLHLSFSFSSVSHNTFFGFAGFRVLN
jgi:hypothetical protein